MWVGDEKRNDQQLFEFRQRRGRHLAVLVVELGDHEFEHAAQPLQRRIDEPRRRCDFNIPGNRHSADCAQLGLQGSGLDAKNELLQARFVFVHHIDAGRNHGGRIAADDEFGAAEPGAAALPQHEMLLDQLAPGKMHLVGRRARAEDEVEASQLDIAPRHLEALRPGAEIECARAELGDERMVEFVRTARFDQRKAV